MLPIIEFVLHNLSPEFIFGCIWAYCIGFLASSVFLDQHGLSHQEFETPVFEVPDHMLDWPTLDELPEIPEEDLVPVLPVVFYIQEQVAPVRVARPYSRSHLPRYSNQWAERLLELKAA